MPAWTNTKKHVRAKKNEKNGMIFGPNSFTNNFHIEYSTKNEASAVFLNANYANSTNSANSYIKFVKSVKLA